MAEIDVLLKVSIGLNTETIGDSVSSVRGCLRNIFKGLRGPDASSKQEDAVEEYLAQLVKEVRAEIAEEDQRRLGNKNSSGNKIPVVECING